MDTKTYLSESLKNDKIMRWIDNCMPLRFYIAPFRFYSKKEDDYKYRAMVLKALNEWEKVSAGRVRFEVVMSLNESQVNLDWKRVDRKALGQCHFHFDGQNRLYSAEIQIGISDGLMHKDYMAEDEVYHTILHEIGHALGLGHSPYPNDIMYTPHQYGVINLSKGDKLSLQWLYRFEHGATVSELCNKNGFTYMAIDTLVQKIIEKKNPTEFQKVTQDIQSQRTQKDLLEEQSNIADLKRYNLALQNIKISDDMRKYFIQIKKDT